MTSTPILFIKKIHFYKNFFPEIAYLWSSGPVTAIGAAAAVSRLNCKFASVESVDMLFNTFCIILISIKISNRLTPKSSKNSFPYKNTLFVVAEMRPISPLLPNTSFKI